MTGVDEAQPSTIGLGWKDSHWCTKLLDTEPSAICFSRDIVVRSRNGLLAAVCGKCGSARRIFKSDAAVEHHIRLLRLNVRRPWEKRQEPVVRSPRTGRWTSSPELDGIVLRISGTGHHQGVDPSDALIRASRYEHRMRKGRKDEHQRQRPVPPRLRRRVRRRLGGLPETGTCRSALSLLQLRRAAAGDGAREQGSTSSTSPFPGASCWRSWNGTRRS